jgi:hypothetical protein
LAGVGDSLVEEVFYVFLSWSRATAQVESSQKMVLFCCSKLKLFVLLKKLFMSGCFTSC